MLARRRRARVRSWLVSRAESSDRAFISTPYPRAIEAVDAYQIDGRLAGLIPSVERSVWPVEQELARRENVPCMSIGIRLCDGSLGHPRGFAVLMLDEKERGQFGQGRRAGGALLVSLGQCRGGSRILTVFRERHSVRHRVCAFGRRAPCPSHAKQTRRRHVT